MAVMNRMLEFAILEVRCIIRQYERCLHSLTVRDETDAKKTSELNSIVPAMFDMSPIPCQTCAPKVQLLALLN